MSEKTERNWTEKCTNCRYVLLAVDAAPCSSCGHGGDGAEGDILWEPKTVDPGAYPFPRVVPCFGCGSVEMEFNDRGKPSGKGRWVTCAGCGIEWGEGLDAAHSQGLRNRECAEKRGPMI